MLVPDIRPRYRPIDGQLTDMLVEVPMLVWAGAPAVVAAVAGSSAAGGVGCSRLLKRRVVVA
jgi:hypothetical protein